MDWQDDTLLTATQVSKHLGISRKRLRTLVQERRVPAPLKLGGLTRWRWVALRRWIEAVETMQGLSGGQWKPTDGQERPLAAEAESGPGSGKKAR